MQFLYNIVGVINTNLTRYRKYWYFDHFWSLLITLLIFYWLNIHGKNNFAEASKNLDRYRSENNFVDPSK